MEVKIKLEPKLSAKRSINSRSSFLGNITASNKYPGIKHTKRLPGTIQTGVLFKGGTKTVIIISKLSRM
ncbi:hypothetical protein GCM10025861_26040 [Methanobacterium petrolearium]|nr:hypothetical protein GCM10025861_26040 [Methanobacterium petrolearium]